MTATSENLKGGAALLTSANALCAAIGAAQGLVVVRVLGPNLFGAAAVLVAIGAVATNLIDVRITDLVSRLYYDEHASSQAHRTSALRIGLRFSAAGAALIALLSGAGMFVMARALTGIHLPASWFWIAAAAQGVVYLSSFFIFIQRFVAPPRQMAVLQLVSALINAAAMVGCVSAYPSIGGYIFGVLLSALGVAVVNALYTIAVVRKAGMDLFGRETTLPSSIDRRTILKYVAAGNVLGYVKLLHRSADVLLVSFFCGPAGTGIYKLARSMADALYAISEAVGRVYQPRLLFLLQRAEHTEYTAVARSMMLYAGLITAAAITVEVTLLPSAAPLLHVTDVHALTISLVTLSVPFFFVAGLQSWVWPVFVFSGRLGRCTGWAAFAVLAGQYGLGPALFYLAGDGNPAWFCVGYLSYYPLSLLPLLREAQRETAMVTWRVPEVAV